ncbi:MAG: DUF2339 domain-containing protein, partial [bacterium]|nr:DUF2339 domain-containing protein [bacterium]
MEWLLILALAAWVYQQGRTIKALARRLDAADERHRLARATVPTPDSTFTPVPERATPLSAEQPGVAPEPSTETLIPVLSVASAPQPEAAARAPDPDRIFAPPPEPYQEPRTQPKPAPAVTRESISTWLSENGLAWIGGGGLALGGLLLVGYAAQRGFFTPELRLALALILGALMLGASEWILRQKPSIVGGRHLLAAAVSAGAGAVTLYGAVCAAHGLYDLIPLGVAAVLASVISLGLLWLSLRHGEPLALVALVGAVFTPSFTGIADWPPAALTAYAVLIGATGFSIAAARRWAQASSATVIGLLLLSTAPLAQHHVLPAMLIQALASIGPLMGALWRDRFRAGDATDPAGRAFRDLPAWALVLTSLASASLWFAAFNSALHLPVAIAQAALLVILGAILVARDRVKPVLFAAPVGMAIVCQLLVMALMGRWPTFPAQLPWLYALTGLIPAAALWTALRLPMA